MPVSTIAILTWLMPNLAIMVSAIWLAAPESTMSLPITAPNTTMIARDPSVEPKPF